MDRPTILMVTNAVTWFDAPLDWTVFSEIVDERMVRGSRGFGSGSLSRRCR
jgi:hypothetical protein